MRGSAEGTCMVVPEPREGSRKVKFACVRPRPARAREPTTPDFRIFSLLPLLSHEAPRRARGRIAGTVTIALEAPPASLVHDEAASSCAVVCGFAV